MINVFLNKFFDYIQIEKRYSNNTLLSYKNDLLQFENFIKANYGDITKIIEIKTSIIRTWFASLKNNNLESKSINRKISTLNSFFKFLIKQNIINNNPLTNIHALKMPKQLVNFTSEKEINNLLNNNFFDNTYTGLLHKVIIELFYSTGIRVSELTFLKDNNFDFERNCLKILGKGNKERIIPLHNDLIIILKNYIKERDLINNQNIYFFIQINGKPIYVKYVYLIVNKYLSLTTTLNKKSPHILRHTFATHLLQNGAEINAVKELLGHSSLAATQIYTHHNITKLKEIYKAAHPKS